MNKIIEQFKKLKKEDRIMFFLVFTIIGNIFMAIIKFIIKYEKMKEGIVMTKEKALKATRLLEEIETIDMLNEELANFLASEEFDALPQRLYTELFQVIERYLKDKQDELDEL